MSAYLQDVLMKVKDPMVVVGFVGQGFFFSRFFVQWIASERAGKSVMPTAFWILSIIGSVLLATYALYEKSPVFILAYAPNVFIYTRNLMLLKRERRTLADQSASC